MVEHKRRVRRVDVDHAPHLGLMKPTPYGWRLRVKLLDGQVPVDYAKVADRLAHS